VSAKILPAQIRFGQNIIGSNTIQLKYGSDKLRVGSFIFRLEYESVDILSAIIRTPTTCTNYIIKRATTLKT
jgi:hypothetical protein